MISRLFHGSWDANPELDKEFMFLSSTMDFSKYYGEKLFACNVDLGNIFDSTKLAHLKWVYSNGYLLHDSYWINQDLDDYNDATYEWLTPEAFLKYSKEDTWEGIETTVGLIDFIMKRYDSILITEADVTNYYVPTKRIINCELMIDASLY